MADRSFCHRPWSAWLRITFPRGWGLLRASNTQAILVLRFEATDPAALDAYRGEVAGWLAEQGVRV